MFSIFFRLPLSGWKALKPHAPSRRTELRVLWCALILVTTGFRPSADTAFLHCLYIAFLFCGLLLLGPQSGVHHHCATATFFSRPHSLISLVFQVHRQPVVAIVFRQPEGCASFALVVLASIFLQLFVLWRGLDSTILKCTRLET